MTDPRPGPQSPSAGWYDDGSGRQRWWDGEAWTEIVAPAQADSPRAKIPLSTWLVGVVVLVFLVAAVASSSVSGFLIFLAIAAFLTAIYVVITGRRSWALIPNRKSGAVVLAGSLALLIAGAAIAPTVSSVAPVVDARASASGSPSPSAPASAEATFTEESPSDPAVVTSSEEQPAVVVADTTATQMAASALLATIPVKGKAPKTGYDRTGMFGPAWLDVDRNNCDTRNDILARDLTSATTAGTCKVTNGTLVSPYTAETIQFVRGNDTSALVQIDHVVSLSNAWQTGAQQLSQAQRVSLANDPINLLAVDAKSNTQKGAGDAATWLPSNKAIRGSYIARQISVKATYGLWVTQAEHDAMQRILDSCSTEPAVTSPFAPTPAPVVVESTPAPTPVVAPTAPTPIAPAPAAPAPVAPAPAAPPTSVYYENCTAVRAAGAAPLYAGQPGYETPRLDRDGDGIACE